MAPCHSEPCDSVIGGCPVHCTTSGSIPARTLYPTAACVACPHDKKKNLQTSPNVAWRKTVLLTPSNRKLCFRILMVQKSWTYCRRSKVLNDQSLSWILILYPNRKGFGKQSVCGKMQITNIYSKYFLLQVTHSIRVKILIFSCSL